MAVLLLGGVVATIPSRTYLPPQYITQPQLTVQRPQNVYLPPAASYRQVSRVVSIPERTYLSPSVQIGQPQYISRPQLAVQRPVVQQVVRPLNVYLPPAAVQRPAISILSQPQYASPSRTYLPPQAAASGLEEQYDIDLRGQF
ncbi:uncharacterized protein Dvir_GJ15503 [Drosophila virilis]|uniref:Uncharacterized protein n=2 Tax=Drosophila virilis TaxID=7244 RepID=B4MFX0_DROVI|nr:uncharacterized protein Dvir_GJ15503 [Drosophila virilis]